MPTETVTPAASSTKTETPKSDLAAAHAAGQSRAATPPPGAGAPGAGGAPDAAAQKAAADKAAADAAAAAAAAAGKAPSWHPTDDKAAAEKAAADKVAADKAAAEKTAAEAAAAAKVTDPAKFEIKPPEGAKVEPALLEKYRGLAKDLGLSQEQMQKLYDRNLAEEKTAQEQTMNMVRLNDQRAGEKLVQSWGAQAVENDALLKRAWDAIDPTQAVRNGLKHVGLLNWDVANNALVEFAKKNLREDSMGAQTVGKSVKKPSSPEEAFAQGYKDRAKAGAK